MNRSINLAVLSTVWGSLLVCQVTPPPPSGGGGTPAGSVGAVQYKTTAAAFGGGASYAPSELALAAAPAVVATCTGTCLTPYVYSVSAVSPVGRSQHPASATTSVNNAASLNGSHFNTFTPATCQNYQTAWDVFRAGTGLIGTVACGVQLVDNGLPSLGPAPYSFDDQNNPGSQGMAVTGTLRVTGLNAFVSAPDYLLDASQMQGYLVGAIGDTVSEEIVDTSSCVSPQIGCMGFYHGFTAYNSNASVKSVLVAQSIAEGYLYPNGTGSIADVGVQDSVTGNYLYFIDTTGTQSKHGSTEGTTYLHNVDADQFIGPLTFGAITSGTNTGAAMVLGTGSSLGSSGTGTISSNQVTASISPVVISTNTPTSYGSGTLTLGAPASITNGNALIAFVAISGTSTETWTAPAGFTQLGSTVSGSASTGIAMGVFCKVASSESGGYVFSWTNNGNGTDAAIIINVSGVGCTLSGTPATGTANGVNLTLAAVPVSITNYFALAISSISNATGAINVTNPAIVTLVQTNAGGATFGGIISSGPIPAITFHSSGTSNDLVGISLALVPSAVSSTLSPYGVSSSGSLNTTTFTNVNATGVVTTPKLLLPWGSQITGNQLSGVPVNLMELDNSGSSLTFDVNSALTFVGIGGGIHGGPIFAVSSGDIRASSFNSAQDVRLLSTDSSDNLHVGNATDSGSSLENDLILDVQTGKTIRARVNAVDVATLDGTGLHVAATAVLQQVARTTDPGCTTTADIGKFWFDNTTTTTAAKKCVNVAGTLTWVAF